MRATYADGSQLEADVTPPAQVRFERRYGVAFSSATFDPANPNSRTEHFYWLTWAALVLSGQETEPEFDRWLALVSDWDVVSDE